MALRHLCTVTECLAAADSKENSVNSCKMSSLLSFHASFFRVRVINENTYACIQLRDDETLFSLAEHLARRESSLVMWSGRSFCVGVQACRKTLIPAKVLVSGVRFFIDLAIK